MPSHGNIIGLTIHDVSHWPHPNYIDPPRMTWMPIYAPILYAIGTIMVATRLWLRVAKKAGGLWWDDVLMTMAWLGSTMFMVVAILMTERYQCDRAIWNVHPQNFVSIAFTFFLAEVCFLYTQCCVKLSVLLLYHRLVDGKFSKRFMIAIYIGIFVIAAYSVAYILLSSNLCSPVDAWWKAFDFGYEATADYHCLTTGTTWINVTVGIFAGSTDLYVIFLPWAITRSLNLPRRQVIALNFIFSLGFLATVASALRTYYLYEVGSTKDITSNVYKTVAAAYMELQLGIICANAPSFRVFFRKFIVQQSSFLSSRSKSRLSAGDLDGVALRNSPGQLGFSNSPFYSELDTEHEPKVTVTKSGRVVMAPMEHAVRTPGEYEAYNARMIELSRQTVIRHSTMRESVSSGTLPSSSG